jgi:Flp pilus assembly pilin Flp
MRQLSGLRVIQARAQTLAEYALILALIVIVAIAVLAILGQTIKSKFSQTNSGLGK